MSTRSFIRQNRHSLFAFGRIEFLCRVATSNKKQRKKGKVATHMDGLFGCEDDPKRANRNVKRNGGTLKFRYTRNTSGWPYLRCSKCESMLHKHYYVHQCISLPHHLCYDCLEKKGVCRRCGQPFKRKYKALKEREWIG